MATSSWIDARLSAGLDAVVGHFALAGTLLALEKAGAARGLTVLVCSAAVFIRASMTSSARSSLWLRRLLSAQSNCELGAKSPDRPIPWVYRTHGMGRACRNERQLD